MDWLNKFNKEFVGASLDSENPHRNLHKSKKMRKDCYDRNNARNRDILTKKKITNQLIQIESLIGEEEIDTMSEEDKLIEKLDIHEARSALEWMAEELDVSEDLIDREFINDEKKDNQ